jgi:hypothetical protein
MLIRKRLGIHGSISFVLSSSSPSTKFTIYRKVKKNTEETFLKAGGNLFTKTG